MPQRLSVQLRGRLRSVALCASEPGAASEGAAPAGQTPRAAELEARLDEARKQLEAERRQLRQAREALGEAAGKLQRLHEDLLAQAEEQLLTLSLEIARKVLAQEIQAGRYEIDPLIAEAMKQLPARCDVTVHLHPNDHARCKMAEELRGDSQSLRFVADADVRPGECFLETPEGAVETSVETQLAQIAEALKPPE
jgi:flagellar assembly protein FliH